MKRLLLLLFIGFMSLVNFAQSQDTIKTLGVAINQLHMGWANLDNDKNRDAVLLSIRIGFNWY